MPEWDALSYVIVPIAVNIGVNPNKTFFDIFKNETGDNTELEQVKYCKKSVRQYLKC